MTIVKGRPKCPGTSVSRKIYVETEDFTGNLDSLPEEDVSVQDVFEYIDENSMSGEDSVDSVNGMTGDVVLTTNNIAEDTDRNYVTDSEKTAIGNTSGTNTGDQDISGISINATNISNHIADTNNPHSVDSADVGLNNVNNTSDADKPVSVAAQTALDDKADKSNVLELDNTTAFTPDADYEPATKKYVDDATPAVTASDVSVTDSKDYYTGSNAEDVFEEIGETRAINGYDLLTDSSLPDLAFNQVTRVFSVSVKSGSTSFYFWVDSKKIIKTTTQTVTLPNTTDTYYIYFDNSGVLQYVSYTSIVPDVFYENAITGLVYWNATAGAGIVGDERHGKLMDARTHHYNHSTFGSRFEDGLDVHGLADASSTYTQTDSGHFWDEDIRHSLSTQTTHPFLYRLGTNGEWTQTGNDNNISYNNGGSYDVWNEYTGTTWQLTEGTSSTDYWIIFMIATPNISGSGVYKVIGQNAYPSRSKARDAIDSEINKISTDGLPSPEFVFLFAWIARRNGKLEDDGDGNAYYDLRNIKGGASTSGTGASTASDIVTDTTNFNKNLSSTDTDVQTAFETIDDLDIDNATSIQDIDVADLSSITTNQYLGYNSTSGEFEPQSPGTPAAHASTHEDGGSDEISIAGLDGTPNALTTHMSDKITHGTTGNIVGTSDTQTLTNKTLQTVWGWDGWIETCAALSNLTYQSWDSTVRTGVLRTGIGVDISGMQVGDRCTFKQSTGGTKYGIVTKITAVSLNYDVTIFMYDTTVLNNQNATEFKFSHQKNPYGFDSNPSKWMVETRITSQTTLSTVSNNTWYNIGSVSLEIPIGVWNVEYHVGAWGLQNSAGRIDISTTLSTSTTSSTDSDWYYRDVDGNNTLKQSTARMTGIIELTTKDTYYVLIKSENVSNTLTNLGNAAGFPDEVIRATIAYL